MGGEVNARGIRAVFDAHNFELRIKICPKLDRQVCMDVYEPFAGMAR